MLTILRFGRPVLLTELVEKVGTSRNVLLQKLDRCGSKGWVRLVSTEEGSGAEVLAKYTEAKGGVGRRPSVAYEATVSIEEAGRRQAERLLSQWSLCAPQDKAATSKALGKTFSRQFAGKGSRPRKKSKKRRSG